MTTSFQPTKRIIVLVDLAGYSKAFQTTPDEKMAAFLDDFYVACEETITSRNGQIIKFIGDACLSVFPADEAQNAIEAVQGIKARLVAISRHHAISLALGANVHMAPLIEGEFGKGTSRRKDILGRG